MKKLLLIAPALAIVLVGCTTTQVDPDLAEPVLSKVSADCPREGPVSKITVTRDTGFIGSALDHRIYLDGKEAARLRPGQKVTMCVDASDDHYINVDCFGCIPHTIDIRPKANVEKLIRTGGNQGGLYAAPHGNVPMK